MAPSPNPVPEGFHTVTPYLTVRKCSDAIAFWEKAFGAEVIARQDMPSGLVMHATIRIGDSMVMMSDEFPEYGALGPSADRRSPVAVHLYVPDADETWQRALDAGCEVEHPIEDAFWGDRFGMLKDPFDHRWSIASKIEDPTPEEVGARAARIFGGDGGQS